MTVNVFEQATYLCIWEKKITKNYEKVKEEMFLFIYLIYIFTDLHFKSNFDISIHYTAYNIIVTINVCNTYFEYNYKRMTEYNYKCYNYKLQCYLSYIFSRCLCFTRLLVMVKQETLLNFGVWEVKGQCYFNCERAE